MLQQKEKKNKINIDRALLQEATQLLPMLKTLAEHQKVSLPIRQLTTIETDLSPSAVINCDCVFLTEKKQTPSIKKALHWIGMTKVHDDATVFESSLKGAFKLDDVLNLKMNLYHFDRYPMQKLSDPQKPLKIIFYDPAYKKDYKNWNLALHVLSLDPAAHILINLGLVDEASDDKNIERSIKTIALHQYHIDSLNLSLKEVLMDATFFNMMQLARLKNHMIYCKEVYQLISDDFQQSEKELKGKMLLANKRQLQAEQSNTKLTTKDIGFIKSKVDSGIKQTIKLIEDKIENFDKEPDFKNLQEEMSAFLGFVMGKSSRYVTLKLSEGAIKDKTDKAGIFLTKFFDSSIETINKQIETIEQFIEKQFASWELETPKINTQPISNSLSKEILATINTLPDKPFEKQITSRGIGSLIMELRTPLFMLMPFMMIFALFGALVGGEDKGFIDETITFYNDRPCIAITELPESRNNAFGAFLDDLDNKSSKGLFDKEITEELTDEPQLATTIQTVERFGKLKSVEKLDYFFDSKKGIAYIYLNSNDYRSFVIETLYDPGVKLLSISSNKRTGFGIGGLIRKLQGLSEYRYIILVFLVTLISWFIITRKNSMSSEMKSAKNREQFKLNNDLKQHVEKNIKQSLQRFKTKATDELIERQQSILKTAEKALNISIDRKKQQKLNESKAIQKRLASIKNDKAKFSTLRSEHRKLKSKLEQLETKTKRVMR